MLTKKQIEIVEQLAEAVKNIDPEVVRKHILEENEYFRRKKIAQTPTREQMQREYNI